jgi:hypothetical protein
VEVSALRSDGSMKYPKKVFHGDPKAVRNLFGPTPEFSVIGVLLQVHTYIHTYIYTTGYDSINYGLLPEKNIEWIRKFSI